MNPKQVFGVVIDDRAIEFSGDAISRYLHDGTVGKYIYASSVLDQGYFTHITIDPEEVESIDFAVTIWIPTQFVKFVAVVPHKGNSLGFHTGDPSSDQP